jgi:hypothetical protein
VYAIILLLLSESRILEVSIMNTRFKLSFITYLNQRRVSRDSGFALPLAVMIGLCIIVVGLSVVMQAQGNQSKVISQKAKASSMAATETGLTRIQSMMNDVKFVALYPMASWTSAMTLTNGNTSVTINDAGLDSVVNSVAKSTACSSTDATTKENEIKTKLASLRLAANGALTDIDPNDSSKGKYKLVNYTYTGASGAMPSTVQKGGLVIQGETAGSGASSASRIAVDIPISGVSSALGADVAPGLWIKKGGVNDGTTFETSSTTLGNNGARFAANVLFSNCDNTLSDAYVSSVDSDRVKTVASTRSAAKTSLPFPSLPPNPSTNAVNLNNITASVTLPRTGDAVGAGGNYHYTLNNSANTTVATCTGKGKNKVCTQASGVTVTVTKPTGSNVFVYNNIGAISSSVSLPRTTDVASSDGVYRYLVTNIDSNGNSTITISNQEEVNFYLQGNMNFAGSGELVHNCNGVTGCLPTDFQIFAYDSSGSGQICLKGNTQTDAFILAPDYKLGKTGNGAWNGSIFANSWGKIQNCGSNNGATAVTQTGNWSSLPSEFQPSSLSPQIGGYTAYTTQAVN